MEAQATAKRCGRCEESPKQCSRCKSNAELKALRKLRKETGVDNPRLAKHRAQNSKTKAEQRKSAKDHGYTYNKHQQCKGPDQLVEGNTGSTCTRTAVSELSGDGRYFCTSCFDKAYGPDARLPLKSPQCVGLGRKSKVCSNRVDPNNGIQRALRRTGMKAEAICAATKKAGGLQNLVAAFDQSKQCLSCFQNKHPNWAKVLRQFTQCIFGLRDAKGRCQRTAYVEGLCDTHHAAKLPPAKTRCSDSDCPSGEPGVRKNRQVGRCQPCLDAMELAAKRKAAETPVVECPTRGKRSKP
jgi:hypothetical protein